MAFCPLTPVAGKCPGLTLHSVPTDQDLLQIAAEKGSRSAACCVIRQDHLYCCVSTLLRLEEQGNNEPLWILMRQIFAEALALQYGDDFAMFHGAMVRRDNVVLAVTAQSGMGKTTTVLRMREQGWTVLADDMLIWHTPSCGFAALPTWSAGAGDREHLFVMDEKFYRPDCIFQLQRGETAVEKLSLAEQLATLNRGFMDGLVQWKNADNKEMILQKKRLFELSEQILNQIPCYRLRLNLTDNFEKVTDDFLLNVLQHKYAGYAQ